MNERHLCPRHPLRRHPLSGSSDARAWISWAGIWLVLAGLLSSGCAAPDESPARPVVASPSASADSARPSPGSTVPQLATTLRDSIDQGSLWPTSTASA